VHKQENKNLIKQQNQNYKERTLQYYSNMTDWIRLKSKEKAKNVMVKQFWCVFVYVLPARMYFTD